jgi:hypothetical protein
MAKIVDTGGSKCSREGESMKLQKFAKQFKISLKS